MELLGDATACQVFVEGQEVFEGEASRSSAEGVTGGVTVENRPLVGRDSQSEVVN